MMKELVINTTSQLPDDATIDEIIDAIWVKLSAIKGYEQTKNGEGISSEELKKEIKKW